MGTVNKAISKIYNYAKSFGNGGGRCKVACFHAFSSHLSLLCEFQCIHKYKWYLLGIKSGAFAFLNIELSEWKLKELTGIDNVARHSKKRATKALIISI